MYVAVNMGSKHHGTFYQNVNLLFYISLSDKMDFFSTSMLFVAEKVPLQAVFFTSSSHYSA